MKITLNPERRAGSAAIAGFVVVMVVVIVVMGGCALWKLNKKIDQKNDAQKTNSPPAEQIESAVSQFVATNPGPAQAMALLTPMPQGVGTVYLQVSTNLIDWQTVPDQPEAQAEFWLAFTNAGPPPCQFFRTILVP
jgi:hypothetical protein